MNPWGKWHVFMDQAGEGASGGGAAAATGTEGGAPSGGAAGGAAGAGGAGAGESVLAAGAAGGAAGAQQDFIPEKLRVSKEDGTLDLDASARKLAEAYSTAEKRIGTGDIPPKTAEEYAVAVPDAFKETWKPEEDQSFKDFRAKAHEAGMTQKQLDLVMSRYFEMAPKLVAGAAVMDANSATAELKKTWATDADFSRNVRNAYVGANALAEKAGLKIDDIMSSPLGNDPKFLKLMAAIGPEFAEDVPPGGQQMTSQEDIDSLMRSEAYTNPRHADHAKISERVRKYFERKHGTEAAA